MRFTETEPSEGTHTFPDLRRLLDGEMEDVGKVLLAVATAVRRYKSEAGIPLGRELEKIQVILKGEPVDRRLQDAGADIASITRAKSVEFGGAPGSDLDLLVTECGIEVAVEREGR